MSLVRLLIIPSYKSRSTICHLGWTIFDRLYIYKGVVYIVSDEPSEVPELQYIYSKGHDIKNGKENVTARLPTDEDIQVISTKEARKLFGAGAQIIDGVTVSRSYFCLSLCSCFETLVLRQRPASVVRPSVSLRSLRVEHVPNSITHYYHWCAELWFGFWRTYSSLDANITPDGGTTLPPARRLFFNRLDNFHWRDYAAMDQWVARSSFPGVTMEFIDDWRDRAEMDTAWVFDRVVVTDRSAAMLSFNFARYQRSASPPFALPGAMNWWMAIRDNVVQFTGLDTSVGSGTSSTPVITYISRQTWGRRMLIPEDHDKLVKELYKLRDTYGWEVNVIEAEKMTRVEQIRLAARTTVSTFLTCVRLRILIPDARS